ncbi:MAG: BolA/IbaG family iron-sulfur metabolism protein [SAR324 cluster bacterium]|mgnify:FL=1|jgi:acid stress-induced BolA-like protein IbaG/YrbA|nr:BolA/IbaG family iron-sulfur metabolism protein [SAR324 cluster bacterium]MCH2265164.1 BolA/IbaG family iron-sulfur metabolism protein [SAR324 cluster bacterium]
MSEFASPQTIEEQIKQAIERSVPDSTAEVGGDGRHFEIQVVSPVFAGKRTLEKQRIVYAALNDLMAGSNAPVHAIARLETLTPVS